LIGAALYGLFAKPKSVPSLQATRTGLLLGGPAVLVPLLLFALTIPPLKLPYWHVRHLIPAQASFALLVSYGLFVLARRSRAALVLGAAVLLGLQSMLTLDEVIGFRFEPYNRVAACLREGPQVPGRLVAVPPRGAEFLSYYPGPSRKAMAWPRTAQAESRLPPTLWLVYRPAKEEDSALAQRLIDSGYVLQRSALFMKRPSDVHGLRLVLFQKPSR
jgi:hypothetical protein